MAALPLPLFLDLQPFAVELQVVLVVEGKLEPLAVSELHHALPFLWETHVREIHVSGLSDNFRLVKLVLQKVVLVLNHGSLGLDRFLKSESCIFYVNNSMIDSHNETLKMTHREVRH